MTTILDQMRAEHANIAKVLRILESQVAKFDLDDSPDLDLMQECVKYMSDYPDVIHHPKEDIIYNRLKALDPSSQPWVEKTQAEHKELSVLTKTFADTLEELILECVMPRDQISKQAHEFIEKNFAHMHVEEAEIFPRLKSTFKDSDWEDIASHLPKQDDPLFGVETEKQYRSLLESISKSAVA